MNTYSRRAPLAAAAALVAAAALPATAAAQNRAPDPAPDPMVAALEVDFLTGMIPHHRSAVMMAEMAVMKSPRPELRRLAQKIIDDQKAEIDKMSAFLRDWYGMQRPGEMMMPMDMMMKMDMPMMHGMMPDMEARMAALRAKSGGDFDIEFMSAMTDHHAMAVMMAAPVLISGHHADLYTLAQTVVISQGEEIKQMDEWLDAWYGVKRAV